MLPTEQGSIVEESPDDSKNSKLNSFVDSTMNNESNVEISECDDAPSESSYSEDSDFES